jgi:histidinol-phosphate/aromatic aminotransferase/cobyric acid decarboxylase-like protein/choline kinase
VKAIILAAGIGRRMRPLTDNCHKALLEVGGQTIMGRILEGLEANGIIEVYVVTGYRADDVEDYVNREFGGLQCTFIRNERFASTNNIYSMALALETIELDADVILIESDLLYEPSVITRLIKSEHPNVALVDKYRTGLDGTVVSVSEHQVITQVIPSSLQAASFDFSDKFKTLNIYKFSADFCRTTFRKLLSYYARIIDENCYYELILGILIYMQQVQIHAEILDGELWAEVDDPNDLRAASFAFVPSSRRQHLESSWGGYWMTPVTDFAFIRNMYFPSSSVISQLRASLPELVMNYGSTQALLDEKLAYFLRCESDHVHLLNGASQFLSPMLRRWFRPDRVLLPEPTFGEYGRLFPGALTYGDRGIVDLDEVKHKAAAADLVVIVNPNNPTGTTVRTEDIQNLAILLPDKMLLVDESFIEFSGQPSLLPWVEATDAANIVVLKSLSKSLGVPGLRLGYVFTVNSAFSARILDEIPLWNVNSVAEHFLEIILKYRNELDASVAATIIDRETFVAVLRELDIIGEIFPSGANFVLVTLLVTAEAAERLADELLERDNIYVKNVSSKFDDGRVYWRLAVRTPMDNERLCERLRWRSTGLISEKIRREIESSSQPLAPRVASDLSPSATTAAPSAVGRSYPDAT